VESSGTQHCSAPLWRSSWRDPDVAASLGLIVALAFSGYLDVKIAGTLLGAHLGYHAAASGRNRSRSTPPEHPRDLEHQRDASPSTTTTQGTPSPPAQ
jgi:hypothetical protein